MTDFLHNPFYPAEKKSGSISTLSAILWYKSDDWSCSAVIRRLLIESNIFSLSRNNSGLSVRYWSPIRMKAFFFTKIYLQWDSYSFSSQYQMVFFIQQLLKSHHTIIYITHPALWHNTLFQHFDRHSSCLSILLYYNSPYNRSIASFMV